MLEAGLLRKTVYAFRIPGCSNADSYIENGLVVGIDNGGELAVVLRNLQVGQSPAQRTAALQRYTGPGGLASERVLKLADRLVADGCQVARRG
jgi:hypothetical protein